MSTGYYLPAVAELVKTSHEQRVALELTDGSTTWTRTMLSGELTLSEDWSPRASLQAVIPNNFTLEELAALDPRSGAVRVTVTAGYVHPDGTVDMHPVFTGHLRDRRVRRPANTVTLEAASDEALTQDAGWLAAEGFKSFPGVTEALEWFLSYALGTATSIDSSIGYNYRADLTASIPVQAGAPVWEFMADLALAANVRLFVDVDGTWRVTAKTTAAHPTDVTVLDTPSDSEDVLSLGDYYSAAVLRYEWRDAADVDHTIIGKYGTLPGRVYTADFASAITQSAANTAAQDTVRNLSTRGDSYVCTDVAAYWLRPASTVRVKLASGTDVDHLVKQVVFHLANGTMTTTTRQPSNLGA